MIRYLRFLEMIDLHRQIIAQSGGTLGILDLNILQSTIAKPRMSFGGQDLYPDLIDKAAILGYSIINNHPFVDGNQRTGYAAMEIFLIINGGKIDRTLDEQERIISSIAAGEVDYDTFLTWLQAHTKFFGDTISKVN